MKVLKITHYQQQPAIILSRAKNLAKMRKVEIRGNILSQYSSENYAKF
jgi:uncharacterized protein YdeI (BOF family)